MDVKSIGQQAVNINNLCSWKLKQIVFQISCLGLKLLPYSDRDQNRKIKMSIKSRSLTFIVICHSILYGKLGFKTNLSG